MNDRIAKAKATTRCWSISTLFLLTIICGLHSIFQLFPKQTIALDFASKKWFIAAVLHDNANVIENWIFQLINLVDVLGPSNVFVSIVENGDSGDSTPEFLTSLKIKLNTLGVKNSIILEHLYKTEPLLRTIFLSDLRTAAMNPLKELAWDPTNTKIIYLNDIFFESGDIINLINTNNGDFDVACGLDFYYSFYDRWVSRDLNGRWLLDHYPFFRDEIARQQVHRGEPVRVFSCWNGAIIMKAIPFMPALPNGQNRSTHRSVPQGLMYHHMPGESECFVLCKEFWERDLNLIFINPRVKVAYDRAWYLLHKWVFPWLTYRLHDMLYAAADAFRQGNPDSAVLTRDQELLSTKSWASYH